MKKAMMILGCVALVVCVAAAAYAVEANAKTDAAAKKAGMYPANVVKESANVVANAAKNTAGVVETTANAMIGKENAEEVVKKPVEAVGTAAKETVEAPVKAAK